MFTPQTPITDAQESGLASLANEISSAIAYAPGMQDIRVTVTECAGEFLLEGTIPDKATADRIEAVARAIGGGKVISRLQIANDEACRKTDANGDRRQPG
ncbi:BON domain-containing protein [Rhizobium sp. BK251]|uniref:BON domain-containing protein n=1 Tax=Rhizobium sp. BK251 TaxID=2512125 RepID=UPI0010E1AA28|nr:BON domain-containing protein [Rhizobium sp. BK251]TCL69462.1 BON domain-containing protein [Rhizobium sp. BK251]